MRFAAAVVCLGVLCPSVALATSSGAASCDYPCVSMSVGRTGTGGFEVTTDSPTYTPGVALQVTLGSTTSPFKGFLLQAVQGNPGAPGVNVIGTFSGLPAATKLLTACDLGGGVVTHSAASDRTSLTFTWTPPAHATGDITFHFVPVVSLMEWYGMDTRITRTLTSTESADGGTGGGVGSGGGTATGGGAGTGGSAGTGGGAGTGGAGTGGSAGTGGGTQGAGGGAGGGNPSGGCSCNAGLDPSLIALGLLLLQVRRRRAPQPRAAR